MAEADTKPIDLDDLRTLVPNTSTAETMDESKFRVGDPARWLRLAGVLTLEESETILAAVEDFEKVEE